VKGSMRERGAGRWQLRAYAGLDPITGKTLYRTRAHTDGGRLAARVWRVGGHSANVNFW
jgi:hypothetical protein